jgi:hypothetical protein
LEDLPVGSTPLASTPPASTLPKFGGYLWGVLPQRALLQLPSIFGESARGECSLSDYFLIFFLVWIIYLCKALFTSSAVVYTKNGPHYEAWFISEVFHTINNIIGNSLTVFWAGRFSK